MENVRRARRPSRANSSALSYLFSFKKSHSFLSLLIIYCTLIITAFGFTKSLDTNASNQGPLSDLTESGEWENPFMLESGTSRRITLEIIPTNIDFISKQNTSNTHPKPNT